MAERFVPFQSTLWAVIEKAGRGDRASFDDFVHSYRRPLVSFLQARGLPEEDAEDLVQEVFIRIFEKRLLTRLSESKGRFRTYLLAVAKNVLSEFKRSASAQKRAGERTKISLDALAWDELLPADERDEEFDRLWVQNLVQVAFERLKREPGAGDGRSPYDLLKAYTEGPGTYEALAAARGLTEAQVRTTIEVARRKLRKLVQDAMGEYVLSPEEYEAERAFVSRILE